MEKMIVTEYSRPIMLNKVKEFVQRTMYLAEDKVIPMQSLHCSTAVKW